MGVVLSSVLAQRVPAAEAGIDASFSADPSPDYEPPENEEAADYCRYSSDNQSDCSIEDQHRTCQNKARSMAMVIPNRLHYTDHAVSGTKLQRDGLQRMLADAAAGKFKVIFFNSLSRLGRESAITVPMLKKLVYGFGVRFVSVTDGVDSTMPNWELIASVLNVYNEQFIKQLAADVFRGTVGTLLKNYSVGDHRFGYDSVPSPGGETSGRGSNAKPKRVYAINETEAGWVRRIFGWYVADGRSATWIARELTKQGAPKDRRSRTDKWQDYGVRSLLKSSKYVGIWPWGLTETVRDPLTGRTSQKPRKSGDPGEWLRVFPGLKIVEEEVFEAAQCRLKRSAERCAPKRGEKGRLRGSRPDGELRHMLEGLIICELCGDPFHTCGSCAAYMGCSGHKGGKCSNNTTLLRSLAERMILEVIGSQILSNASWRQQILAMTIAETQKRLNNGPDEESSLRTMIAENDKARSNLINLIEQGENDPDVRERLKQRRLERDDLQRKLDVIVKRQSSTILMPTADWVDQQLAQLAAALGTGTPAAWSALRQLIRGPIIAKPVIKPGGKRGYIRAKFQFRTGAIVEVNGSTTPAIMEEGATTTGFVNIELNFKTPRVSNEDQVQTVWNLYRSGMLSVEIARETGISKTCVCNLLKQAHAMFGEIPIDGRKRRHTLERTTLVPTASEIKSEEVMRLFHENKLLISEIADCMGFDRNTVTRIVDNWHVARRLPVPDSRQRRKMIEDERHERSTLSGR